MATVAPGTVKLNGTALESDDLFVPQGALQIQDAIDRESTCDLTVIDLLAANHYREGNPLLVYDGNEDLAYAGWLTSAKEKLDSGWASAAIPALRHTLQATDNHYLANKRDVVASYENETAGAIFTDIIDTVLAEEGVYAIRNLLTANQSDVETDTSGFATHGGGVTTLTRDTTQHWHGAASLKTVTNGSIAFQGWHIQKAPSFFRAGGVYLFSAYVLGTAGHAFTLIAQLDVSPYTTYGRLDFTATGAWQRVSCIVTIPATLPGNNIDLGVITQGAQVETYYSDGVMLEPRPNGAADAALRGPSAWELGGTSTIQSGPTVTGFTSNYGKASECFDALAQRANYWWQIDKNRRAWFADRSTITAPWAFDGSQDAGDGGTTVEVEHTSPNYRNSQYIGGGTAKTDTQIETRIGDGNSQAWTMGYPLAQVPTIEVAFAEAPATWVAQTVGIAQVDAGKDFYWNAGKNQIVQDSSGTMLRGPTGTVDTLRVTYVGSFPFTARAKDDGEILLRQMVEGGTTSGIVDDFESDSTLDSTDVAFEVANSYLGRYATSGDILTFKTREGGLAPGQLLNVDLPIHGLPSGTQMLITEVSINDPGDFDVIYSVKAISGPVDSTWIEFFKVLTAKKLQNQDAINVGTGSTLVTLADFEAAATPSATFTPTVYACPLFPWTLPVTLC